MVDCEMCGAKQANNKVKVEGTIMTVCSNCERFGEKIIEPKFQKNFNNIFNKKTFENTEEVKRNISELVKNARRNKGLSPELLAKALHEKESIILKIESGNFTPSISLAKKIGKFLEINLIEKNSGASNASQDEDNKKNVSNNSQKAEPLTMGDLLEKALKKK
jgi:putative transcription factor